MKDKRIAVVLVFLTAPLTCGWSLGDAPQPFPELKHVGFDSEGWPCYSQGDEVYAAKPGQVLFETKPSGTCQPQTTESGLPEGFWLELVTEGEPTHHVPLGECPGAECGDGRLYVSRFDSTEYSPEHGSFGPGSVFQALISAPPKGGKQLLLRTASTSMPIVEFIEGEGMKSISVGVSYVPDKNHIIAHVSIDWGGPGMCSGTYQESTAVFDETGEGGIVLQALNYARVSPDLQTLASMKHLHALSGLYDEKHDNNLDVIEQLTELRWLELRVSDPSSAQAPTVKLQHPGPAEVWGAARGILREHR